MSGICYPTSYPLPYTATGNPLQGLLNACRAPKGTPFNFTSTAPPRGSYYVADHYMSEFYRMYVDVVDGHNVQLALTEKPGPFSPILIDLDFRYARAKPETAASDDASVDNIQNIDSLHMSNLAIDDREPRDPNSQPPADVQPDAEATPFLQPARLQDEQPEHRYTQEFISKFVETYRNFLGRYILLTHQNSVCYVFERPTAYAQGDQVKDGIHLIFPFLNCSVDLKLLTRAYMITQHADLMTSTGSTNSADDILDRAVIDRNNWYMYGSGKPGKPAYTLTRAIDMSGRDLPEVLNLSFKELVKRLSVRGKTIPDVSFLDGQEEVMHAQIREMHERDRRAKSPAEKRTRNTGAYYNSYMDKHTMENLEFVRDLVDMLGDERAEDEFSWMQVGWCLHNISRVELLDAWIGFSRRSNKFQEGECEKRWALMRDDGGLGMGSLIKWAKEDNTPAFDEACRRDIGMALDKSAQTSNAHYLIAKVLHNMFRFNYVCTSRKFNTWYEFRPEKHRWHKIDMGHHLCTKISNVLYGEYIRISGDLAATVMNANDDSARQNIDRKRTNYNGIASKLLQTSFKKNIMTEASELFYVEDFEDQLDSNPHLLGFKNGVFDLEKNEFRNGKPEDYISLSTHQNYEPYNPNCPKVQAVQRLMEQIHVDPDVRNYCYMLMTYFLSGVLRYQQFYFFCNAQGSNGKSSLIDLFMRAMGDYSTVLPTSLLMSKRSASNAATPELVRLKGRRFAVLQEPGDADGSMNTGLMKELTGGDKIVCRDLFSPVQSFANTARMVMVCNQLPDIAAQDGGTWRRVRAIEFKSRFLDNPDPEDPLQFKVDTTLSSRYDELSQALISYLIHIHPTFIAEGLKEPDEVMRFTREYQAQVDVFYEFVNTCISYTGQRTDKLRLSDIYSAYKSYMRVNSGDGKYCASKELKAYMDSRVSKSVNGSYIGYRLKPWEDVDEEES